MSINTEYKETINAMLSEGIPEDTIRSSIFDKITVEIDSNITEEFIRSIKTEKGNTQVSERIVIEKMREVFVLMGLSYEEAGSQQSKDFRNVGGIGLNIEIKKTDNPNIYFNDTCPSKDIYYVVFFTGKEYKRKTENNIPPKLLYLNGEEFVKDSPWINDYIKELTILKDTYARGENKKKLCGIMEVYPRPTFKANIAGFLGMNPTTSTDTTSTDTIPTDKSELIESLETLEIIAVDVLLQMNTKEKKD
jgi:hypothetical protein